jgi:hypothetical protein
VFDHLAVHLVGQGHVELFHEPLGAEAIIDLIIDVIGVVTGDHGIEDHGIGIGGGDTPIGPGTVLQSIGEVDLYLQSLLC